MITMIVTVTKLTSQVQQTLEMQGYEIVWSRITTLGNVTIKVRRV